MTAPRCLGCLSLSLFSVLFSSVLFSVVESCGHWCVASLLLWLISHWFVVSFVSVFFFVCFCFFHKNAFLRLQHVGTVGITFSRNSTVKGRREGIVIRGEQRLKQDFLVYSY